MDSITNKIRDMWARQRISPADLDYRRWECRRAELVRIDGTPILQWFKQQLKKLKQAVLPQ